MEEKDKELRDDRQSAYFDDDIPNDPSDYREETSAEIAAPVSPVREREPAREHDDLAATGGTGIGYVALAISILSLFVWPVIFGIVGIVLGFIARGRGATGLGAWAIGIGVVSLIIGIFILPFF
ncbi:DUF4190 domain-containing protein [Neobacillus massiliamazoniensis]|uniref:YqfX n=1 Tax=Neobacillus massiliamazoniensis TaxID=1499688 RepID=A0A0U1P1I3_9BACI|nr:DUF4190 domain-containing protein [Neobacillus massiliamazoniensis]CRK84155.1 YqfX [Neobacillus massiliamazoniensis]